MVKFVVSGVERRVDGKSIFIKKGYITVDGKVVNLDDCVGEPIEIVIQEFVNVFVGGPLRCCYCGGKRDNAS